VYATAKENRRANTNSRDFFMAEVLSVVGSRALAEVHRTHYEYIGRTAACQQLAIVRGVSGDL
jgi:hypothetical protein